VSGDPAFYDRALARIDRLTIAVGALAIIGGGLKLGWRGAIGCAIGAALSFLNLKMWKALANAIGDTGKRPRTGSAVLLGLRYLLLGLLVFVIIKYFGVGLLAIFAGLLVSVTAVLLEIVYELIFTSHKA
jgi:hypothetical protein